MHLDLKHLQVDRDSKLRFKISCEREVYVSIRFTIEDRMQEEEAIVDLWINSFTFFWERL